MTIVYKPVLIESAEQAEALPPGTIIRYRLAPTALISDDERVWVDGEDNVMIGADLYAARDVWEVLVPIEAEEEAGKIDLPEMLGGGRDVPVSRYVTPWESA